MSLHPERSDLILTEQALRLVFEVVIGALVVVIICQRCAVAVECCYDICAIISDEKTDFFDR